MNQAKKALKRADSDIKRPDLARMDDRIQFRAPRHMRSIGQRYAQSKGAQEALGHRWIYEAGIKALGL